MSPSFCSVLPRYLNLVTCGSWADCILPFLMAFHSDKCTLSLRCTPSFLSSPSLGFPPLHFHVSFVHNDGYQYAFSPYVWDLLLISRSMRPSEQTSCRPWTTAEIYGVTTRTISEAVTPAAAQKRCAMWRTVLEVWQAISRRVITPLLNHNNGIGLSIRSFNFYCDNC